MAGWSLIDFARSRHANPSRIPVSVNADRYYTTIPSVREILAVQSTRIEAELLCRDAAGNWPEEPELVTGDKVLTLASIDYATTLSAFYRTTGLR